MENLNNNVKETSEMAYLVSKLTIENQAFLMNTISTLLFAQNVTKNNE